MIKKLQTQKQWTCLTDQRIKKGNEQVNTHKHCKDKCIENIQTTITETCLHL